MPFAPAHQMNSRLIALLFCLSALLVEVSHSEEISFQRDIKPILSDRCFACHGPDQGNRKAELRLDQREAATDVMIVPGDIDSSELVARITSSDPELRMPPPAANKQPLNAEEIAKIKKWITAGAPYDAHWSYQSVVRPAVPQIKSAGLQAWVSNPVDAFLAAKYLENDLQPAAPAEKRTLLRRLTFDLTGLPPSPEQIQQFEADESPFAFEQQLEYLLSTPQFGERMAIYWLDLVRYADTNGIHGDNHREISPYRDYVIRAFNQNVPFDQFTREQIAGDLMAEPSNWQKIASGYNRLLMTTREGGAQPKEYLAKYSADRVRNASSVWLGSTLACAECHDHKFDPFSTKDFYSFAAFFADIKETAVGQQAAVRIPTDRQTRELAAIAARRTALEQQLKDPQLDLTEGLKAWESAGSWKEAAWQPLEQVAASTSGDSTATVENGVITVGGKTPDKEDYEIQFKTSATELASLRLQVFPDKASPASGPGRASNGNFVLNEVELYLGKNRIPLASAVATHSQSNYAIASTVDGNARTGWAILPQVGKPQTAVFKLKQPLTDLKEKQITIKMRHQYGTGHNLAKFQWFVSSNANAGLNGESGIPAAILAILNKEAASRTEAENKELLGYYRTIAPELAEIRKQLANLTAEAAAINKNAPETLISQRGNPRDIRVLPRGNWLDDSGEVVLPEVPHFLEALSKEERPTRMDLANWLVEENNPLVARVFVNRLWLLAFGKGLVDTPDDFGSQGSLPTHPELLDWLACEFQESGWDVKHVMRLIVSSQAYQMQSQPTAAQQAADPGNKLITHQNRFRLPAEMIRDNALVASGLLVTELGGQSVKPYQPEGYWKHLNFPKRSWQASSGEDLYRRGLYTYWCRTFLHPAMRAFDAPTREECSVVRPASNTPLQALVLLNDPTYVEAARTLAADAMRSADSDADRLAYLYRRVLARPLNDSEAKVLLPLVSKHKSHYAANTDATKQLLSVGQMAAPTDIPAADLAAWTSVARIVLNLHETIMRY
jgi:hypothetical protein